MNTLTIVIVSYNVRHYVEQALLSLRPAIERMAREGMTAEVVVVDNHSHDGSVAYLQERFPDVRFVASPHNLGFARANNLAIRQSESRYVLLLNPDTVVGEEVLARAVSFMEAHPDGGALGVRMMQADGFDARESRRGVPTPLTSFFKMAGLCARFPRHHRLGHYYMGWLSWDEAAEIEIVSGAFCLLRRQAIDKVGLLDEDFFMYGEDIDLSYRLLKGGYHNYYLPHRILHYKGESTHKSSFRYVHVFYEAMLIFFRKHFGQLSMFFSLPIKTAIYGKAALALMGMTTQRVRRMLGFFTPDSGASSQFVIVVAPGSEARCRQLVAHLGLSACIVVATGTLPSHDSLPLDTPKGAISVVTYDTSAFSYADIMAHFAARPQKMRVVGFFYPDAMRIITPYEVLHIG